MDGSNIYGSTDKDAKLLRTFRYGLLIDSTETGSPNIDLLPKCDQSVKFEEDSNGVCHLCKVLDIDPDGSPPVRCIMLCIPFHIPGSEHVIIKV